MQEKSIINALSSRGQAVNENEFNTYQEYLEIYDTKPSYYEFYNSNNIINDIFDFDKFMNMLKQKFYFYKIIYQSLRNDFNCEFIERQVINIGDGIIFDIENSIAKNRFTFEEIEKMGISENKNLIVKNYIYFRTNEYESEKFSLLKECFLNSIMSFDDIDRSSIEMVSVNNNTFYAEDYYLKDNFVNFTMPDLHYGDGFEEFHESLYNKIKINNRGLIVLHGLTGTGKTQYIRKLIKDFSKNKEAKILYFSPSMISSITNPEFIDFINDWSKQIDDNKKRIIILEDAEPLLESRNNNRNNGITNLLNLTSGLLSDILGIQYICTFNSLKSNIDQALLREERLIAIKEFKNLPEKNVFKLADYLDIPKNKIEELFKEKNRRNLSLAEIYSVKNDNEILKHNFNQIKKNIGFR